MSTVLTRLTLRTAVGVTVLGFLIPTSAMAESKYLACEPAVWAGAPTGDAERDARSPEALFRRLDVKGFTDVYEATDSIVAADFNKDGLNDLLVVNGGKSTLRLLLNKGCFDFEDANLEITDSAVTTKKMGRGLAIANVADFDGDGWLDIFLTRNTNPRGEEPMGNLLLMSKGSFRVFKDIGAKVGVLNSNAYNRGTSIADIDQDGWLDVVVAADQIGSLPIGIAQQRLYNFSSSTGRFSDGTFLDLGGTAKAVGFGGEFKCSLDDKAGPLASLRDLDGDGDLDLIHAYHQDLQRIKVTDPCTPAQFSYGIQVWRNQIKESGNFSLSLQPVEGFGALASHKYNPAIEDYEPVGEAIELPYLFFADTDNDGDLDALGLGGSNSSWRLGSTTVTGLFWRNDGNFKFVDSTSDAGFDPLNWQYLKWSEFWGVQISADSLMAREFCARSWQPRRCENEDSETLRFYGADAAFGDFNNDGWLDVVVVDRHESDVNMGTLRNVLFMNRGDGTFEVTTTEFSGLDINSIALEAADLNNDGLLDLVTVADPDNSYIRVSEKIQPLPLDRYASKVFWNTGAGDAALNHWIRMRFTGISHPELIGARVERLGPEGSTMGIRDVFSNHSYKSAGAVEVHWGLDKSSSAKFKITLQSGKSLVVDVSQVDRIMDVDLANLAR